MGICRLVSKYYFREEVYWLGQIIREIYTQYYEGREDSVTGLLFLFLRQTKYLYLKGD